MDARWDPAVTTEAASAYTHTHRRSRMDTPSRPDCHIARSDRFDDFHGYTHGSRCRVKQGRIGGD
jgi:hypothetical protein